MNSGEGEINYMEQIDKAIEALMATIVEYKEKDEDRKVVEAAKNLKDLILTIENQYKSDEYSYLDMTADELRNQRKEFIFEKHEFRFMK